MPPTRKSTAILRLAVLPAVVLASIIIAWRLGYFDLDRRLQLAQAVERLRDLRWTEGAYVVLYAIAIAIVLPASLATLVGGALFGAAKGAVMAWLGALAGTALTHVLAHRIARAPVKRLFGDHAIIQRMRDQGSTLGLLRLRLLPVAPFGVLDYAAGVAGVSLPRLLAATAIGMIPSVIAYAYVGSALIRGLANGTDEARRALWIAGGVTAFMLLLSLLPHVIKKLRT